MREQMVRLDGRILFLTEDPGPIKRQLAGESLDEIPNDLCANISTDEITPGWVCFWYDQTLGRYALVGLRNGAIETDSLRNGGFQVLVSGPSTGCGSSREQAPYAQKAAGIRVVIAPSIEKIYRQNCQNIGVLTSTDMGLIPRLQAGETIPLEAFTAGLDPIARGIVEHGGLFAYNQARLAGTIEVEPPQTKPRPMTLVEKIIARHAVVDAARDIVGIDAVQPGDALFCRTDVRFSHDYVTPMAASLFREGFGAQAQVVDAERVFAFRDHLTFLADVMPDHQKQSGLLKLANNLASTQEAFCKDQGIRLYGEHPEGGSEAICHNAVLEDIAWPNDLVCGTDSHTCTAGAIGAFAFGVGATDMANAWRTRDIRVTVPASVRIDLEGRLPATVAAKDVMLTLMTDPYFKEGKAIGQVLEFGGPGLTDMPLDERATLTNMAVEAGATTAIIAADEVTAAYLAKQRPQQGKMAFPPLRPDPDATYIHRLRLDLDRIVPMVATPGDPRNGVPITSLREPVHINLAYGGSCTGGKAFDMDLYARVLGPAAERGRRIPDDVQLFIQFGSQKIKAYAQRMGYIDIFERVGATLVNPSCGACIKAGPGVSDREDQVSISAINRNFPGRSGPGQVYLASPQVVAASALAGHITTPEALAAAKAA